MNRRGKWNRHRSLPGILSLVIAAMLVAAFGQGAGAQTPKTIKIVVPLSPGVIVVNSASPYRTLADLLNAARAKPGALTLASVGPATAQHIGFEMLKRAANINMTYVPYAGGAPAINALLGGHITSVFAEY